MVNLEYLFDKLMSDNNMLYLYNSDADTYYFIMLGAVLMSINNNNTKITISYTNNNDTYEIYENRLLFNGSTIFDNITSTLVTRSKLLDLIFTSNFGDILYISTYPYMDYSDFQYTFQSYQISNEYQRSPIMRINIICNKGHFDLVEDLQTSEIIYVSNEIATKVKSIELTRLSKLIFEFIDKSLIYLVNPLVETQYEY